MNAVGSPIIWPWGGEFYPSFQPGYCSFPTSVGRDEEFTPWIQFQLSKVYHYDEERIWDWGSMAWRNEFIEVKLDTVELRIFHHDMQPEDAYTVKAWRWEELSEGESLVWSTAEPITIQDLIGPVVQSQTVGVGFVVHIKLEYHLWGWFDPLIPGQPSNPWDYTEWVYDDADVLEYDVAIEVPVPPPPPPPEVYAFPLFNDGLSFFPTFLEVNEQFSPVLVVDNIGKTGQFYIDYWYKGAWFKGHEGTIVEGARFSYIIDPITITDLIGAVGESTLADIRWYCGYIEPGVSHEATSTDSLATPVYVKVEEDGPPTPTSSMALLAVCGGLMLIGGAVMLWPKKGR